MTHQARKWSRFPFVAKLADREGNPWLGTVVGVRHILTAAHCVVDHDTGEVDRACSVRIVDERESRPVEAVQFVRPHEDYDYNAKGDAIYGDIAIVGLRDPVDVRPVKRVMCEKAEADLLSEGRVVLIGGQGVASTQVRQCNVQVVAAPETRDTDFFHAGMLPVTAQTEKGDSGGPLLVKRADDWYQIGIHSRGPAGHPATKRLTSSTRISLPHIYRWIEREIARD